jgi:hypothetical protein
MINTPRMKLIQGNTFVRRINILNDIDPEDRVLIVIRDICGNVLFYQFSEIVDDGISNAVIWRISHAESSKFPVGTHKYGISYYKDCDIVDDLPVDGNTVKTPIASGTFVVGCNVAREEGLK